MAAVIRSPRYPSRFLSALVFLAFLLGFARAQEKAAEQSLFVTVRNPITSEEFSRIKAITSAARERYHRDGQKGRLKIVYDFNPDNQASGSTLFGPCLDLADYLLTVSDVTTIAFVHAQVTRHTVLPVLACQEIVIAPGDNVGIGNVLPDADEQVPNNLEQFYKDSRVQRYQDIARHRGRAPAIALKMLDRNLEVLRGTRPGGGVWYIDARLKDQEKLAAVEPVPVLPAGSVGFFNGKQAQDFGYCRRADLKTRQEVKTAYDLPNSSLRGDRLEGRNPQPRHVEVRGSFNQSLEHSIKRRLNRAIGEGGNCFILELNCGGGDPTVARSLGVFLLELKEKHPVRLVAYVTLQSRDLAVFVALGCGEIVMDKRADLAHFPPAQLSNEMLAPTLEDMARRCDFDPLLARAMVDRGLVLYEARLRDTPDRPCYIRAEDRDDPRWVGAQRLKDKEQDKLLAMNAEQALKFGFALKQVDDLPQVYQYCGVLPREVREAGPDGFDAFADFLRQPWMEALLVLIGVTCLILEMKAPGVSLPGILAAVCFVLFFWAHAQLAFLWLAVALFVLGLVLIGLEIFVMPGVAVVGASGVLMVLAGLGLATLERWPHTESEWMATVGNLGRFGAAMVGAIGLAVVVARYLPNIPYANRLMLVPPTDRGDEALDPMAQIEAARRAGLLGAIGVAATTLRPSGMVRFGDEYLDVVAEGSYVDPGVQVIEIEGNRIVVKEV